MSPATTELTALGATVQLSAEVRDQNGQVMAGAAVTWASSAAAVATVSASGLVTAVTNGSATITATAGAASGSATVTVAQVVSAVNVTPDTATVLEGDTLRLTAAATDANGQVVAGVEFVWASGDTAVAVVDASGLVTGVGAGEAEVTAITAGVTGRSTLTVVALTPADVTVTPDTVVLTALGQTVQLAAEVRDQAGSVMEGIAVAWSSGDTAVAVVDSAGLVSAVGVGAATITAVAGEASGDAHVTVTQSVDSVAVAPPADTIAPGDTLRLVAEAYDESGRVVEGASLTWSSDNNAVATVDASGLVRGTGEGTATITATAGEASGTSEITVTNRDRAALVALYNATGGPSWRNNEGWLTDLPLGAWFGVETDGSGRVTRLQLGRVWDREVNRWVGNGLSGPIPAALAGLDRLTLLDLSANELSGPIPAALARLASLTLLDLSANELSAPIPPELARLTSLTSLYLWQNRLSGPIPPELGNLANLEELSLNDNSLSGRIPSELARLASLTSLILSDNKLSGPIPPELGNLANLEQLYLGYNGLSGRIPPELGNLANLRVLRLIENALSGPIPPELGNLANLEQLILSRSPLSGSIPAELGNLANLELLSLSWTDLAGPIPAELGNLLRLNSLDIFRNRHTGSIPPELSRLTNLRRLNLSSNALSGPVPPSLVQLQQLSTLYLANNSALCLPGTSAFVTWLAGVERQETGDANPCHANDVAVLRSLFEVAGGNGWTNSQGWLGEGIPDDWYGVDVDSVGRVEVLDLTANGLTGHLPASLGSLSQLSTLKIGGNALTGRLPLSLATLSLREFRYSDTQLCAPLEDAFQAWLNTIPTHESTNALCTEPASDREVLEVLYHTMGGPDWTNNRNWLTDAPLWDWHGVRADSEDRVVFLGLFNNNLTGQIPPQLGALAALNHLNLHHNNFGGSIPPELGELAALESLSLRNNNLTGSIPAELGKLTKLQYLELTGSALSGPIPSELGNLANLESLDLGDNGLSGPIPAELARLPSLTWLDLSENAFSGPIPAELGDLAAISEPLGTNCPRRGCELNLQGNNFTGSIPPELGSLASLNYFHASHNDLEGPVPPEFGNLERLRALALNGNSRLSGAFPSTFTRLGELEGLVVSGTDLCAPSDPAFRRWLEGVQNRQHVKFCDDGAPPAAYLVQAVQSLEFPVPLVAGKEALLRVFVTATRDNSESLPSVRASFYHDGALVHVADISGGTGQIPTGVREGSLAASVNSVVPAAVVQPGLDLVVEVDPDGTLDPALGVPKRIPETGRLSLDVREMPRFELTLIPFLWTEAPNSDILDAVASTVADPEEWLWGRRPYLPVGDLIVRDHEPVMSSSNHAHDLIRETGAIRVMEGGTGYFMGTMSPPMAGPSGTAEVGGWNLFSLLPGPTAHELGHSFNLFHAPCGGAGAPDPAYPYPAAQIGVWGYDPLGGLLVPPVTTDIMSYCGGWISDYHYAKALRHRLIKEGAPAGAAATGLLLWGGIDTEGTPFLEPAFVIDAPAALPDSAGDYRITGRTAGGGELFSLSFTMPVTAHGDGSSGFAFALPVRAGWEDSLATITLSGPGGSVTLDGESDIPMTILRDPRTGQVRSILRDTPLGADVAADAIGAHAQGREVLFSRGIPGAAAWRR